LPPVHSFRDAGLSFGIGLDASSFDDDEDMLREVRLVWRSYRGFGDADLLGRRDVFDAVLVDGRRTVVGEDGGGRLVVGAPADIAVLDLAEMSADVLYSGFDIADLLLTRMAKRHLKRLIVGGRTIVENGACVSVDRADLEAALLRSAKAARAAAPPDDGRIARLQGAVEAYYGAGFHKQGGR